MKKVILILSAVLFLAMSCTEEEVNEVIPASQPATVEFSLSEIQLSESASDSLVVLTFSKSAPKAGSISVAISTTNKVITDPAAENGVIRLAVAAGATKASFKVKPVNNQLLDGYKVVSFQIQSATDGLVIGSKKISTIKINDDESPVQVFFAQELITTSESAANGFDIIIPFTGAAAMDGTVLFTFTSDQLTYGEHYTFEPAGANGMVTVPFLAGSTNVTLKIKPVNDFSFNGDRVVRLKIAQATGGAVNGDVSNLDIKITDDEPTGFTKGYRTSTGMGWSSSRFFQYNPDGTVSRIMWEAFTPSRTSGQTTYEYINGKVSRENEYAGRYSTFTWENGKVTKQETFVNGSLAEYKLFGYDQAGNIGEAAIYYRQPDGSFKMGFLMVYLYYTDGNLYKHLVYNPNTESGEYALVETRTYSGYIANKTNPFPIEFLPNVKAQINLPSSYELDKEGQKLTYQFTYEFNSAGNATKRYTTGPSNEVSSYEYF